MSKHLFANEQVMKQYLSALLSEEEPEVQAEVVATTPHQLPTAELSPVAKLLQQVHPDIPDAQLSSSVLEHDSPALKEFVDEPRVRPEVIEKELEDQQNSTIIKEQVAEQALPQLEPEAVLNGRKEYFDGQFQALFFEVAGLTLAVPLKALGGIHQLGEINQLFGKPKWFQGVMLNRDEKLSVIDTARWVMPEKYTPELADKLNYQYLIMLGDSPWGLSAEKLVNNITLHPDDVKWRTAAGKRPWLAGVIKEKMCALIDVESLIHLLEKGLDSRAV
ncbi:chemotaxis protein CheW [Pseudoalteromonas fenneropenaei]|uniref:Chemotaxis protein CheW n=1 Tax=Pseudoalteromonas fenneropenaei TaxID=1737459 RepID=A0ABV7CGV8_9GAMM